jgi:tRNA(adenine34) deaminase
MENKFFPSFETLQVFPMDWAYQEAVAAFKAEEVPVGAVILYKGQLLTRSHNAMRQLKDATAHAELLSIRQACALLDSFYLEHCVLYVTLEPCAFCAAAIALVRIPLVYFGSYDPKGGGVEHNARIFDYSLYRPQVYGGFQEQKCSTLLRQFFSQRRSLEEKRI